MLSKLKTWVPRIALATSVMLVPPRPGWSNTWDNIKAGNLRLTGQGLISGLSGVQMEGGGQVGTDFDLGKTVNPFDFERAPWPKITMWSRLGMEIIDAVDSIITGIVKDLK